MIPGPTGKSQAMWYRPGGTTALAPGPWFPAYSCNSRCTKSQRHKGHRHWKRLWPRLPQLEKVWGSLWTRIGSEPFRTSRPCVEGRKVRDHIKRWVGVDVGIQKFFPLYLSNVNNLWRLWEGKIFPWRYCFFKGLSRRRHLQRVARSSTHGLSLMAWSNEPAPKMKHRHSTPPNFFSAAQAAARIAAGVRGARVACAVRG